MTETNSHGSPDTRKNLSRTGRWVIKIGSALATKHGLGLNIEAIEDWAAQIAALKQSGYEIVVVASGSVAEGAVRLGWASRPHSIHELQAAAAVGQMGLVRAWDRAYEKFDLQAAQVLLTHEDLADRRRYLNSRSTLWTLLRLGVIPVINENDTVATDEIRFGDNDSLAGLVSNLVDADLLVILTDQEGLMTADPRTDQAATLIAEASVEDPAIAAIAGSGGAWGRGGMRTKLAAAKLAARSATSTVIASGFRPNVLHDIAAGEEVGTLLAASNAKLAARKQWLASSLIPRGQLVLDEGACKVIRDQGRSLLAVGVLQVIGDFQRGELVACVDQAHNEVGKGLVNYDAAEAVRISGQATGRIESILGYVREPELIHRDNLVIL
ncbi:MAG TPA: glutamate 5-kinase [Gammaproteobacteria bacterium]|jgi:glutamate 5-kinase|nr:glutamate 5-kinase [Gammaproteobacteria bacterium]